VAPFSELFLLFTTSSVHNRSVALGRSASRLTGQNVRGLHALPFYDFDLRASYARTLLPAALASVPFGFVLVRVRVRTWPQDTTALFFSLGLNEGFRRQHLPSAHPKANSGGTAAAHAGHAHRVAVLIYTQGGDRAMSQTKTVKR